MLQLQGQCRSNIDASQLPWRLARALQGQARFMKVPCRQLSHWQSSASQ